MKVKGDFLKKMYMESDKLTKKLKSTHKRNPNYSKCERFCEGDYRIETDKLFKKTSKKFNVPYKKSSPQEQQFVNNVCKKTYCNTQCDGYNSLYGRTKTGFNKAYKPKIIDGLKERGAVSACVYIPEYDPFHK
jgi:hypothetical protein